MRLNIMIGLPGSGKSTYAAKLGEIVVSSDMVRKELYGDAAIQGDNRKIFDLVYKRVRNGLKEGKDVVYDATNMTQKDRRGAIAIGKEMGAEVVGIVMAIPIGVCKKRNSERERVVPEFVIERMVKRFEIPLFNEGFNMVVYINPREEMEDAEKILEKCKNFDQKNSHHALSLYDHCVGCEDAITYENEFYSEDLRLAARYHDIGKFFTQSEPDEKGECHYYGHENYGAYLFMTSEQFTPLACRLINYHMIPYNKERMKSFTEKFKGEADNFYNLLLILHDADGFTKAH